ncbi:MAG: hypothetical protein FWD71_12870 [Oscillospiraceae bacterium]|nr:hypothetical protein [Oscillospiraceae bacterium]
MLLNDIIQALTPISIVFAIVFGYSQFRRAKRIDERKDDENGTAVLIKLENVMSSISEIKAEITSFKSDHDELVTHKEKLNAILKRIDDLENEIREVRKLQQSGRNI